MKIFLTSLIFSLSFLLVNAQQDRFIYLQTENKQPFFVKINNKVLNSYPLGYLIIPKLDDGLYSIVIGFPGSSDEQGFNCSINKNDVGFIIKKAGEKQWQLLNVQTDNIIIPGDVITKPVIAYEKETDPFSTMLASAVHDSTILRKDVVKEIFVEKPPGQIQKDTLNALASNADVEILKPGSVLPVDSLSKDIAKQTLPEKPNELNKKDTSQSTVSSIDATISKVDNTLMSDSGKNVMAKEIAPEKSIQLSRKDTSQVAITNRDIIISQPDSIKNYIAKESTPGKTDEIIQKDTAQTVILSSDIAVTKSKKKRLKKNDKELPNSSVAQKDAEIEKSTIQKPVLINDVAVSEPVKKRRSKKNNNSSQDSAIAQKDLAKESIQEKTKNIIQKDTTQTIPNSDVAVTKSKRKKLKQIDKKVQDSAIAQNDVAKGINPEKINETKDIQSINSTDIAILRSIIKRKSRKNSKEGIFMLYVDDNGDTKDTISVLIPSDKKKQKDEQTKTEPVVSLQPTQQDDKLKALSKKNKAAPKISDEEKQIIKEANKDLIVTSAMINSDCKNFATDEDFLKIRKKMVSENNDEDMVKAARKYFKTKCFTTEQIKNLSVLFLQDKGKYMFFNAAYPFVSDSDTLYTLENQLSDSYYITRFRAMIHK